MSDEARDVPCDAGEEGREDENEEHAHLEGVEDGAGCTEIWERLSENREGPEECDE